MNPALIKIIEDNKLQLHGDIEYFAEMIARREREACAKLCEAIDAEYDGEEVLATWCAEAIRARGER